ncbi:hypothetical protein PIB30_097890 [Stylosanthes scabra]|uniref:Retrotransposon gag domain-containing protein n=1 Tax=Stylosanthes scabra TaxID=79078 RepID=A0ABU6TYS3_9FABA|nr:hypothetical protein [Stylosanthes scabra]
MADQRQTPSGEIMAYRMPSNFTLPTTLKAYDGIGDPKVHVTKFKSMMLLNVSAIYTRDSDYLSTIKQGQHESLRDYITRFTKVAMKIPNLSADVHLHAIKSGLRP